MANRDRLVPVLDDPRHTLHHEVPVSTPMPVRPLHRYTLEQPEFGRIEVVSFLSPQDLEGLGGLPGRAILARMRDPEGGPGEDNLEWNGTFLQALHEVVSEWFPRLPDVAALALGPSATHVHVRVTRPGRTGRVEQPSDVMGRFAVRDGAIDPDSYEPHEGFLPITEEGVFLMHPDLERAFLATLGTTPEA